MHHVLITIPIISGQYTVVMAPNGRENPSQDTAWGTWFAFLCCKPVKTVAVPTFQVVCFRHSRTPFVNGADVGSRLTGTLQLVRLTGTLQLVLFSGAHASVNLSTCVLNSPGPLIRNRTSLPKKKLWTHAFPDATQRTRARILAQMASGWLTPAGLLRNFSSNFLLNMKNPAPCCGIFTPKMPG